MAITARFIADFSSFYEAVQRADAELKDWQNNAEKVGKSLNKMVDQFSGRKLIEDATMMSRAIEEIGGVSKLTATELEAAGAKAAEAVRKMAALGIEIPPALRDLAAAEKQVSNETETMSATFTTWLGTFATIGTAIAAVTAAWRMLTDAVAASVTAAADAETAESKLTAALVAQGTAVPEVTAAYAEYAAALQKTTTFSDDTVQSAEALLVAVGDVMPRDMEKALTASANLAAVMKTDLASAAMLVARAAEGSTQGLRRAGIVIEETKDQFTSFDSVLDQINGKLSGQAAAAAQTYEGRIQQLANAWNNLEEGIGRAVIQNETVLEAVTGISDLVAQWTAELKDNREAMNLVSDATIVFVKGLALLADAAALAARAVSNYLTAFQTYLRAAAAVASTVPALSGVANQLRETADNIGGFERAATGASAAAARIAGELQTLSTHLAETRGQAAAAGDAHRKLGRDLDEETDARRRAEFELQQQAQYLAALDQTMRQYYQTASETLRLESQLYADRVGPAERLVQLQQLAAAEQTLADWALQFITNEKTRNEVVAANAKTQQAILAAEIAQREKLLNLQNQQLQLELEARARLAAKQGQDLGGNALGDPLARYQQEMAELGRSKAIAPGIDTTAREQEIWERWDEATRKAADSLSVVVGANTEAAKSTGAVTQANYGATRAASSFASALQSAVSWAEQSAKVVASQTSGAGVGSGTDPRVMGLLSQGYTIGEAQAIVGGYGGMIQTPGADRKAALAGTTVNLTMNGMLSTDRASFSSAVNESVMSALKGVRKFGNG